MVVDDPATCYLNENEVIKKSGAKLMLFNVISFFFKSAFFEEI